MHTQPNTLRNLTQNETMTVLGDKVTCLATGELTNNTWSMFKVDILPDNGPPLHAHLAIDEAYYLLSGELTVTINQHIHVYRAGDFVYIPRNCAHTYKNHTSHMTSMLVVTTPSGLEDFFREISTQASRMPLTMESMQLIANRHGIQPITPG